MARYKTRPTLEQHVEMGQRLKDIRNSMRSFEHDYRQFLTAVEARFLLNTSSSLSGRMSKMQSRLEDVMFADHRHLDNTYIGVYYHDDEVFEIRDEDKE